MKTKAIGAVYVSECQSAQGSAQVGAQLKTMKDQVSNEIEKFEDEVEESEKQIADAMKKLNVEKAGRFPRAGFLLLFRNPINTPNL